MGPKKHKDDDSEEEESEEESVSEESEEGSESSDEESGGDSESGSEESDEEDDQPKKKGAPVVAVAAKKAPTTAPQPSVAKGPSAKPSAANVIANKPHDEEFAVEDATGKKTPPENKRPAAAGSSSEADSGMQRTSSNAARPGAAAGGSKPSGAKLENNPNDESFAVEEEAAPGRKTPPGGAARTSSNLGSKAPAPAPTKAAGPKPTITQSGSGNFGKLQNNPNDEFEDVEDDMPSSEDEKTPPKRTSGPTGSQVLKNERHDEAFDVSASPQNSSQASSPGNSPPAALAKSQGKAPAALEQKPQAKPAAATAKPSVAKGKPLDDDDEETDEDEDESSDDDATPKMKGNVELPATSTASNVEYNPQDYAFLNAKVSREVRDLFGHITSYQPTTIECPTKLIPFVPSYIPCVGDIDTFCKIPRPDGKSDGFGLVVADEPSCNQSNPAIVKLTLEYAVGKAGRDVHVDSVENASSRPQVIDKWIADIKKIPKQLPTVTYTKPMPQIEQLMQIWPPEFEAALNSDAIQLPSPQIDLDIYQYVRVLCAILDIPTYSNLVESLHVMFTLYLEFRANQHFQHS